MAGVVARARRAKRGRDSRYATKIRETVAKRDGYCRWAKDHGGGECDGVSSWAHLGDKKRYNTRGLPPEERHTTSGSLMLCTRHHHAYDTAHTLLITGDADGELHFEAVRETSA